MRMLGISAALLLSVGTAAAQRHQLTINAETPEGQVLQQIGNESDQAKKLALLEEFATKYPKHDGIAWVYEQMVGAYSAAGQNDKALEIGEKLLAVDPADIVTAHGCLKAAEAKKDPDLVLKWSNTTSAIARKVVQTPQPKDEDAVEDWKKQVDFAKQVDVYTEYSLYAAALQTPDPKKKIMLGEALEQRNPQSQYLPQMAEPRFQGYMQTGDTAKAIAVAEKTVEKDQSNVEMLLAVASGSISKKEPAKVMEYSKKAIEVAAAKPKPQGVADADWATWKEQVTARAHWMMGVTYAADNKWVQADQELRAALPGIKNSPDMLAEALFYLGVANYRLGEGGDTPRIRDALRFSEECAAMPGRFQGPARTNVKAIRSRYRVQ